MLNMSFLARAFRVSELSEFSGFVIEARVNLAKLIGVWIVEMCKGMGMA